MCIYIYIYIYIYTYTHNYAYIITVMCFLGSGCCGKAEWWFFVGFLLFNTLFQNFARISPECRIGAPKQKGITTTPPSHNGRCTHCCPKLLSQPSLTLLPHLTLSRTPAGSPQPHPLPPKVTFFDGLLLFIRASSPKRRRRCGPWAL